MYSLLSGTGRLACRSVRMFRYPAIAAGTLTAGGLLAYSQFRQPHGVQEMGRRILLPTASDVSMSVADTPGLAFVPRDQERIDKLRRVMESSGRLTLIEGPSGCGKTTAVKHVLKEMCPERPVIYLAGRDCFYGRPTLGSFASAFGLELDDLPDDRRLDALDIVRAALSHRRVNDPDGPTPVFVIDNVERLFETKEGTQIVQWCLGATCNQLLSVLFISSDSTVESKMRHLSGFDARLRVLPASFATNLVAPEALAPALCDIQPPSPTFNESDAQLLVQRIGTHMGDVYHVQQTRAIGRIDLAQALNRTVIEQAVQLRWNLTTGIRSAMYSPDADMRLRPALAVRICREIASRPDTASLDSVYAALKSQPKREWSSSCRDAFSFASFSEVVQELVAKNVLRSSYRPGSTEELLSFHRPVKKAAFHELEQDHTFQRQCNEMDQALRK